MIQLVSQKCGKYFLQYYAEHNKVLFVQKYGLVTAELMKENQTIRKCSVRNNRTEIVRKCFSIPLICSCIQNYRN